MGHIKEGQTKTIRCNILLAIILIARHYYFKSISTVRRNGRHSLAQTCYLAIRTAKITSPLMSQGHGAQCPLSIVLGRYSRFHTHNANLGARRKFGWRESEFLSPRNLCWARNTQKVCHRISKARCLNSEGSLRMNFFKKIVKNVTGYGVKKASCAEFQATVSRESGQ